MELERIREIDVALNHFWNQIQPQYHKAMLAEVAKDHVILQGPVQPETFFFWLRHAKRLTVKPASCLQS